MSNYKTYKLILEPLSGLTTPLQADIIWGHLVSYLSLTDSKLFEEFLNSYRDKDKSPAVIFSDGMPALIDEEGVIEQFFPRPLFPKTFDILKQRQDMTNIDLQAMKIIKWVSSEDLESLGKGDYDKLDMFSAESFSNKYEEVVATVLKNNIPNGAEKNTEIYSLEEKHLEWKAKGKDAVLGWTIFCKIDSAWSERLINLIKVFLAHGYGKKKGVGKGAFKVLLQEAEKDLPNVDNPNAILVISSFVPAPNDPSDGYWEVYTKYGKLGEASVNLPLSGKAEDRNVFKSPITMLKPGAVFKLRAGAEMLDYYGIKDLNSFKKDGKGIVRKEKEYVHPALALVIAYRL